MNDLKTTLMALVIGLSGVLMACTSQSGATGSKQRVFQGGDGEGSALVPFDDSAVVVAVEASSRRIDAEDPTFVVTVAVSGNLSPVSYVELFVEGESVGQQNNAPYRFEGLFPHDGANELVALTKLEDNSSAVSPPISIIVTK